MSLLALLPFISIGATLMSPLASQMDAENKQEKFYKIYITVGKYVFSLVSMLIPFFYFLGYPLLTVWLGGPNVNSESLIEIADNTVIILVGVALAVPGFILRQILIAVGRHWNAAFGELVGATFGISVGYFLMVASPLGVKGMAIGICLAFIIRGAGFNSYEATKYFSISLLKINSDVMLKPMMLLITAIMASKFLSTVSLLSEPYNHKSNFIIFASTSILWIIGMWTFIIEKQHRRKLLSLIR